ncbi:MAG: hypothetical protein PHE27_00490 [Alphaproteobacteria bacterium]|nr:hypothetical protein [Alphaproteobacteria bacterium]
MRGQNTPLRSGRQIADKFDHFVEIARLDQTGHAPDDLFRPGVFV